MLAVSIRITTETRQELEATLCRAFKAGDPGMVKRATALLGIARGEPVKLIAAGVGVSPSTVYGWLQAFLLEGVAGLRVRWRGGRPRKLTKTQRERLAGIAVRHPQPLLPRVSPTSSPPSTTRSLPSRASRIATRRSSDGTSR